MHCDVNLLDKTIDLIIALIQSGILTICAIIFTKKTFKAIINNKSLKDFGISDIHFGGRISRYKMRHILTKATHVKMCYISGENLFYEYFEQIKNALTRPDKPLNLELLLCKPNTSLTKNIEDIEKEFGVREEEDPNISESISNVFSMFKDIQSDNLTMKMNTMLYFFPYLIAYYDTENGRVKEAYMNYHTPPRKSKDSIFVHATVTEDMENDCYYYNPQKKKYVLDSDIKNIVVDLEKHFEYSWNKSESVK